MLTNLPVVLEDYKIQVTEEPVVKTYQDDNGNEVVATDRQGAQQYTLMVFGKQRPKDGRPAGKGVEVKVTLETEPGEDITDGAVVELINPRVSYWAREIGGQMRSGISYRATGIRRAS